jgi:hypothetical protein
MHAIDFKSEELIERKSRHDSDPLARRLVNRGYRLTDAGRTNAGCATRFGMRARSGTGIIFKVQEFAVYHLSRWPFGAHRENSPMVAPSRTK